jgi:hypothetical protein
MKNKNLVLGSFALFSFSTKARTGFVFFLRRRNAGMSVIVITRE